MAQERSGPEAKAAATEAAATEADEDGEASELTTASEESRRAPRVAISVDPLGFLLFGPTAHAEAALGRVGLGAGVRWFSAGLLANKLFLNEGDRFAFSYGLSLHGNYYFIAPLTGPHLGLAVELLHTRGEDDAARIATISNYIVPQLEGGYRHHWGHFMLGGVIAAGYAARLSSRVEDLPGGDSASLYSVNNESSFYGSARLDLGVLF